LLEYIVMGVTVAIVLLLSVFVQGFATFGNLRVIASNSAALLILSCGMGMVIISRGLDLSMVAVMVAGAATFATFSNAGYSEPAIVGLTLLVTAALGLANGALVGLTAGAGMFLFASWQHTAESPSKLGAIVFIAMTLSCFLSGVSGVLVPLTLKKFGADPATASSIFLTTATDVASMGFFLGIATLWLM